MGIVCLRHGEPLVFEAMGPVKVTPLRAWIARGVGHHFVAERLRDARAVLTSKVLARMEAVGWKLLGRRYDWAFSWSVCNARKLSQGNGWKLSHPEPV